MDVLRVDSARLRFERSPFPWCETVQRLETVEGGRLPLGKKLDKGTEIRIVRPSPPVTFSARLHAPCFHVPGIRFAFTFPLPISAIAVAVDASRADQDLCEKKPWRGELRNKALHTQESELSLCAWRL